MASLIEWATFWVIIASFGGFAAAWPISWALIRLGKERAGVWVLGGGFVLIVPAVVATAVATIAKAAGWF